MKKFSLNSLPFELIAAFATWLLLFLLVVYSMLHFLNVSVLVFAAVVGLMLVFICSFFHSTYGLAALHSNRRKIHILLQWIAAVSLYFLIPINYLPILVTIWSAQLPRTFGFMPAVLISGLACIPIYFAVSWYWHSGSGAISALVYWMFNVFAVITMDKATKEELAKEQANQLNRELIATQSLLTEATKQSERLRISRNIHDVVGHHLTALTINLQVAAHLSSGRAKVTIEQCHSVAKLLLSDVREAVSEIRDKSIIDLSGALQRLFDQTPSLKINFDYDPSVSVAEVCIAEAIVRCVQEALTNTLKHGQANQIWISLQQDADNRLALNIKDDGCRGTSVNLGNGLVGMEERVRELGGTFSCQATIPYFQINIKIPVIV